MRRAVVVICSSCRERLLGLEKHVFRNYLSICSKTIFKGVCVVDAEEHNDMEDYGIAKL